MVAPHNLRYFITAAERGSFRRAATALGTQESAVSRCIRDLEDKIGASLFIRSPGGVHLTLAGQRFLRRARHAMEQIEEGAREVRAIGGNASGHLTVGLFSSLASGFLSRLFDAYDDRHPGVHIDFVDASAREHSAAIEHFKTDIAFTIGRLNVGNCEAVQLWTEGLSVALPVAHPLAQKEQLSWADLAGEIFLVRPGGSGSEVRDYISRRLDGFDTRPTIRVQRVGRYSLLGLVAARRGVALVIQSETAISIPGVAYRPIAEERLPFFMIFSARNGNPAARVLISLARKMSRETA
ncbi:LysR family transcriptional regulator [Xanthobacter versatilis]|uniref:LysR substrate-binding domain-containing protein n=1 Tax=Xanthobacter autotrophicus (strain ATCC BAA-1158 / Py2) TaxID=78245 RepID=UPI003729528D